MRAAVVYWELLEGKEKPVVGSTCKQFGKLIRQDN